MVVVVMMVVGGGVGGGGNGDGCGGGHCGDHCGGDGYFSSQQLAHQPHAQSSAMIVLLFFQNQVPATCAPPTRYVFRTTQLWNTSASECNNILHKE